MKNRKLIIKEEALEKVTLFTRRECEIENGGLIYGRQNPRWVQIIDVSDSGPLSRRSKFGIQFDGSYLSKYTKDKIEEDIFVLGTWHSHPTGYSLQPSNIDIKTMLSLKEYFEPPFNPIFWITKWENNSLNADFYTVNFQSRLGLIEDIAILKKD